VTDRSGCGLAELTILQAVAALSTGPEEAPSVKVLDEVDRRIGLGPSYAYPMVCDLTKPWVIPLPLLAISGNAGDRTFPQGAEPVHTECRLSRVGEVIVAAEAGATAPVPIGLINGTWWRGGAATTSSTASRGTDEASTPSEIQYVRRLPATTPLCVMTSDHGCWAARR
jgi:hypothetical protein